jgi:chromosomal replication initiator protein
MQPTPLPYRPFETNEDAARVWTSFLTAVREQVNTQSYKTWFEPILPIAISGNQLTVQVPNQFFYDWLEEHYGALIDSALTSLLGVEAKLVYLVSAEEPTPVSLHSFDPPARLSAPASKEAARGPFSFQATIRVEQEPIVSNLNPRYTFDNFVKGDSNQLARAAALAVSNSPGGTSFNPLVFYGGTGLGKTHLMHALGNFAVAHGKAKRVLYVSSEKFTVDFVEAIEANKAGEFSQYYRTMDLLIVDDIQFFSGKEKTQDNFFHTFNTLYQFGKQIVLSSDVPPKELKGLDERLISRFQSGLTADIQAPDLETRTAILQKKSQEGGLEIPQDVIEHIAATVTNNIRELEGCLISLLARASLENREITLDLAKDVLRVVANKNRAPVNIEQIQKIVCEYYNIPLDLLRAKTRKQEIVLARQTAMYLAKELTASSLKTIGLHFGGRDHSTVIHACQSIVNQMQTNASFQGTIMQLKRRVELRS